MLSSFSAAIFMRANRDPLQLPWTWLPRRSILRYARKVIAACALTNTSGCKADAEYRDATQAVCGKMRSCGVWEDVSRSCERSFFDSTRKYWNHDIATACRDCLDTITCDQLKDRTRPVCEECPEGVFPTPGPEAPVAHIAAAKANPCEATIFGEDERSKPRYVGMPGWISADPEGDYGSAPWIAHALKQVGPQKWEQDPKRPVEHKSPVTVVEQEMEHTGHGMYHGRLTVQDAASNELYVIDARRFTPRPYWRCPDVLSTHGRGPVLAEVIKKTRAVDRNGKWVDLKEMQKMICGKSFPRAPTGSEGLVPCETIGRKRRGQILFVPLGDVRVVY